ncbi:hypothetical protein PR048_006613 [Dryococelus australis]|uniref:Hexamerin-like protein 2 n=1 Tax=Dryococelus australis TaxID=614101 RepID=A0ABQ9IBF9_9NEOP|nr:hypothetical protein PR048_006613 [Dryococelus australis]
MDLSIKSLLILTTFHKVALDDELESLNPARRNEASEDFLQKQLKIMKLFLWQYDTQMYDSFSSIVHNFKLEDNLEHFQDSEAVRNFVALEKADAFFPKSKVFTLSETRPRKEAKLLFDILYNAKDFDTFFKTAVYTREWVNKGLFYYVFRTVLGMREDTKYFYYPAAYEIYPSAFLDERVIQKARDAKIRDYVHASRSEIRLFKRAQQTMNTVCGERPVRDALSTALQTGDYQEVVIPVNYTGKWDSERDPESVMAYFREDLGLNMLNVAFHSKYPTWFDSAHYGKYNDRKGELFLHYLHQLIARYYLERLSNNLPETSYITEGEPLVGYFPGLRHSNGAQVTPRQPFTKVRDTKAISLSEYHEHFERVMQAISLGYAIAENGTHVPLRGEHGLNILGEMLGFVGDNINYKYYDSVYYQALYLLGAGDEKIPPSALLHPDTALRDPLYYQNIETFFRDYMYEYATTLPKYKYDNVAVSGLNVESVDVDKLITYFEDVYVDLLPVTGYGFKYDDNKVDVSAKLRRLNHSPFSYRVSVSSDKEADVLVKVFITPKYDPQGRTLPMDTRIFYAFEIDRFPAKVSAGKNIIQRRSHESTVAVSDPPTFKQMWNKTHGALNGKETFVVDKVSSGFSLFFHRLHFMASPPLSRVTSSSLAGRSDRSVPRIGQPAPLSERVKMKQRRNERAGETTVPTCENPGATPPGIEPASPRREDYSARPYGFPQHLLLPKGDEYGLPVQFVVAVFSYEEASSYDRRAYDLQSFTLLGTDFGVKFPDPRPISFPLDRPFRSEYDAQVPNIFTKEVRIFHKTLDEINETTQ